MTLSKRNLTTRHWRSDDDQARISGGYGAVPLVIPILLAGLAAWAARRGQRVTLGVAALVLAVFTFISGFSIGGAYIPAAWLLIVAAGWAAAAERVR